MPTCLTLFLKDSITYFLAECIARFFLESSAFSFWYNTALLLLFDTTHGLLLYRALLLAFPLGETFKISRSVKLHETARLANCLS